MSRQRRLTPAQEAKLCSLRKAGLPLSALAARFGIRKSTVLDIIQRGPQ
jgi:hypothetical protein